MCSDAVDRYGLMGYPVSHSRSPVIHRLFALQTGQRMSYELLPVPPGRLEAAVREFGDGGGKGLNITVPHKTAATDLVDQLSERATRAGAVNTLVFQDREIFGDNTDGIGLIRDLTRNLRLELAGASILILGAGGAARGILGPLLAARPRAIAIANRSIDKARALAETFGSAGPVSACSFRDVPALDFTLLINATSAGLKGEKPPWPRAAVGPNTFCYDLSYGLTPTPFSQWARECGAGQAVMGWGMLVEQAAESFHLWRGVRPDTAPVLAQLVISAS
ncbi:MAG TPA: shikimate dehydrogenase [Woeseiaceae bacterium]|nr:shikimate dehydrogenase [Woeseiaceae bacterium]